MSKNKNPQTGPGKYPFFAEFLSPEKAHELHPNNSVGHYQALQRSRNLCEVCDQPVWRYGETSLCFPCCTGESDASGDYELEPL